MGVVASGEAARLGAGETARALLRQWPRLLAAYAFVGLALYGYWPQIAVLVTHVARSLLLAANPIPLIGELSWTDSGCVASDRMRMFDLRIPAQPLLFTFGFPLGAYYSPKTRSRRSRSRCSSIRSERVPTPSFATRATSGSSWSTY